MNIESLDKLCIHTFTNKPWSIDECIENYARAGIGGITVWRETIAGHDLKKIQTHITDAGLTAVSIARGGFFTGTTDARTASIIENKKAIDECAALQIPVLVLVCGANIGQTVNENLEQIEESINQLVPYAREHNLKLAIEPLHPMYAPTRSAINSMKCANDMCDRIASPWVGVAIDVFHLWWDHDLEAEITRCGETQRIFAFHICDYKEDMNDMLMDRGLMGEGAIQIPLIRSWVEKAGFTGLNEVEIFSHTYWSQNQHDYLNKIITAYQQYS
ncbi:MAG: sugar phosphate isomerase/epimerase [Planctomycetes bacterium]|nr:sugar phosphate isomerase/epimerase [Planctomycetota bacterium]